MFGIGDETLTLVFDILRKVYENKANVLKNVDFLSRDLARKRHPLNPNNKYMYFCRMYMDALKLKSGSELSVNIYVIS